jgi:parvulin-like peptidyl-prolyl isomerase
MSEDYREGGERNAMKSFWYGAVLNRLSAAAAAAVMLIIPFHAYAAEKAVAKVGDTVITEADLQDAVTRYVPRGAFHTDPERSKKHEYRKAALDDLIDIELLWREARKRGVTVPEADVEAVMQSNTKRFGSEDEMKKAMKERGFTPEVLRERIGKTLAVNALLKDLTAESRYTDEELRMYYEENQSKYKQPDAVHLYHILINVDPSASEDVWQEKKRSAEQLLEKIRGGEDFGDIAYKYSEDPYKFKNGDLGLVHRGRLSPRELEDAAFGLKQGETSGVLRTIHGFHILRAGERVLGETKTFDEMKDRLKKDLEKKRFESKKEALIENLKKEYPVEIYLEPGNG